jgi:hypothetical protein
MSESFGGRGPAAKCTGRSAVWYAAAAAFESLEGRTLMSGGEPGDPIFPDLYEPNNTLAAATNLGMINAGQVIPSSAVACSYDAATKSVTFTYTGQTNGALPHGNYRAQGACRTHPATRSPPTTASTSSRSPATPTDRKIDLTDFTTLAANFNGTNKTFSQADFSYDGKVDLTDFTILAANFNKSMPALPAPPAAAPALSSTVFTAPIVEEGRRITSLLSDG